MNRVSQQISWRAWPWLLVLALLTRLLGCESQALDSTGGETHFLRVCSNDPDACGTSLSCLCGVCTVACQIATSCSSLPNAECTARSDGTCEATSGGNICDVRCTGDAQCAALSSEHRCRDGACRLSPEPVSGGGGDASGGTAGGSGDDTCQPGTVAANGVLVVGDSFFATSHQITGYLEDLARSAGVLTAGERYRDSSRLTANALALSSHGIQDQYESAAADSEVRVVIMNGGGADVLLGSCDTASASCPVISAASQALDQVLLKMFQNGVDSVIFVGYPDPGPAAVKTKMDALRPLLEQACDGSQVPCFWLDLRGVFAGNYSDYVLADGMNPTALGSEATATAIWALMQEQCIAQ